MSISNKLRERERERVPVLESGHAILSAQRERERGSGCLSAPIDIQQPELILVSLSLSI